MAQHVKITVRHQHRRSLMMRAVHGGYEVYVPVWMQKDSAQVQRFINEGLQKLTLPETPPEQTSPDDLRALVDVWAARMGLQPGKITLRAMQRKWGSCSGKGNITLNTALCWLPPHLAEYVVVHELAHLRELNHGPKFKALLAEYLPDWQAREHELNAIRL